MIIRFWENNSSNNTIHKTLNATGVEFQIGLRRDTNLQRPEVVLKDSSRAIENLTYCELVELGRFYFVDRLENIGDDFYRLYLDLDVLETFKSEILVCNARLTRNIRQGDYLDVALDSEVNPVVTAFESDSGFDGEKTLILSTVGE